ncbi:MULTISPECIES: MogA/MoaB family molybdenum cofactor biosynthesis protein [Microbacterium]|mgnify:CR=1 FL=1|uniref:MogA/MoaB family molybdenum cofactor biosynthesis protein n=1 Tax=Microbacterium aurantiacum TaxID=162393 RepID=A0AAJ2LYQ1_9MICO|nr:MogA/MoaB family molybdenum cofactor biosynthesis protein [Microbacterium aurantiacum]MBN9200123.1 MogA/MoaB family molybdenum cofactor biosynthesis protein [Microbacterium chocolatum]MDN4464116.1 MogA/MoaB family molybdenum cofactor biosynthesis protein [Microbacterium aurantiacum]MDS0245623.1 MogA/MoaB family molybdenum cofactor biosynthesis protein [Microbacterium aurantiacum]ODT10525.1 MAG: molybdenum cofactor biosynthesis protein [Microbacterium sp. SCN 70-18]
MIRAAVLTVSDRSAAGTREDRSGPVAVAALRDAGFSCDEALIIPDGADSVERAITAQVLAGVRLIVTTGGTGLGPRDETPEGTSRVLTRPIPGIAEELRRIGTAQMPTGMISRAVAGVVDPHGALVVNLPGSPGGVRDGMPVIVSIAAHVIEQVAGGDH